jgi:hypothetical protein
MLMLMRFLSQLSVSIVVKLAAEHQFSRAKDNTKPLENATIQEANPGGID